MTYKKFAYIIGLILFSLSVYLWYVKNPVGIFTLFVSLVAVLTGVDEE